LALGELPYLGVVLDRDVVVHDGELAGVSLRSYVLVVPLFHVEDG